MNLSEYNRDQIEAIQIVRHHLMAISSVDKETLFKKIKPYLQFRKNVAGFQEMHLGDICTEKCFTSQTSACCNREGIAVFFADVVVNSLISSMAELDALEKILIKDQGGFKCVYLMDKGCAWHLKPIVCEMFLCDHAKDKLSGKDVSLMAEWYGLRDQERQYTWPDRPVLFDELEEVFLNAGINSPLMYFHKSPGLLRVKAKHIDNLNQT